MAGVNGITIGKCFILLLIAGALIASLGIDKLYGSTMDGKLILHDDKKYFKKGYCTWKFFGLSREEVKKQGHADLPIGSPVPRIIVIVSLVFVGVILAFVAGTMVKERSDAIYAKVNLALGIFLGAILAAAWIWIVVVGADQLSYHKKLSGNDKLGAQFGWSLYMLITADVWAFIYVIIGTPCVGRQEWEDDESVSEEIGAYADEQKHEEIVVHSFQPAP
jgi:hypothetical protein